MMQPESPRLVLASASRTRRCMLQAAGVAFTVIPSTVDEAAVRRKLLEEKPDSTPSSIAVALACAKAEQVSIGEPDALVIGSDQVLEFDGGTVSKPQNIEAARAALKSMRGKTHRLHSAVLLAQAGQVSWSTVETARLTMRPFSDDFLDAYLTHGGADLCQSVGAYQIEGLGIQLFDEVDGHHFTILGMPLLALLAELRTRKVIRS